MKMYGFKPQPIIPTHARYGVCALCNYTEWCVPEDHFSGRNICVDTQECAERVQHSHEVAARADLITEIRTLCDKHLLECWGFVRAEGETPAHGMCFRCAYETEQDWQLCQVDEDGD